MFVNLDEATFGGYKVDNQALKNFITEPKATMQEKFNQRGLSRGDQPERQALLCCSDDVASNHAYWGPLLPLFYANLLKTRDAFYKTLMGRDLTVFNVRMFPQTEARVAMMVQSRDNVTAFLQHLAMHPDVGMSNENQARFMTSGRLYELYGLFVGEGGVFGRQTNKTVFAKRMTRLLPGLEHRTTKERGFMMPKSADLERMMRAARQWSDDQFRLHTVWNSASTRAGGMLNLQFCEHERILVGANEATYMLDPNSAIPQARLPPGSSATRVAAFWVGPRRG
ncbi:g8663 [Coccomyxa elongata]